MNPSAAVTGQHLADEKVAVIGLGYVGLPVALGFARHYPSTIGFDIDDGKVQELRRGHDRTGEHDADTLGSSSLWVTSDPEALRGTTFFVVTVPTPVDRDKRPDLSPVVGASVTVGRALSPGAVVVYESTVYPGVTEDVCGPVLERESGLRAKKDFALAYSPERLNPGDREHTLERITKVVAGHDDATLQRVAAAYGRIVDAGIHCAPSIQVAEAAKVFENTQRDLNIALMNELALICDRLGIRTTDVLAAAGTKWNFLGFTPGLVGGHCIGVDPYYLTARAEQLGYQPEVILAGRRINDRMGAFIAGKLVRMLIHADLPVKGARVGILGLTFKENVSDLRNSRVPDIVEELAQFGIIARVHDPLCSPEQALHEYGIGLCESESLTGLDGLIVAVPHARFLAEGPTPIVDRVRPGGVLVDVRSVIPPQAVPEGTYLWSL
jgi:UDP-N-acetyl-D-glucosamine/UDP-N-acetyl-D-galactosamine dehydrogenase